MCGYHHESPAMPFQVQSKPLGTDTIIDFGSADGWKLLTAAFSVTTSATVFNRDIRVQLQDLSGNVLWQTGYAPLGASSIATYVIDCVSPGTAINSDLGATFPINAPNIWNRKIFTWHIVSVGTQTGDSITNINGLYTVSRLYQWDQEMDTLAKAIAKYVG